MRGFSVSIALVLVLACKSPSAPPPNPPVADDNGLRTAETFASIINDDTRARALFSEASRVLLHPRCANCHPADEHPRQGDNSKLHYPPVFRGDDNRGVPSLRCGSCHQEQNYRELAMPGAPDWHLAPKEMVFIGRTPGEICAGLKDNQHNGGKTLAEVAHHIGDDVFVRWGFSPGPTRSAPPGSQATLAGLIVAWIDAGAACPEELP